MTDGMPEAGNGARKSRRRMQCWDSFDEIQPIFSRPGLVRPVANLSSCSQRQRHGESQHGSFSRSPARSAQSSADHCTPLLNQRHHQLETTPRPSLPPLRAAAAELLDCSLHPLLPRDSGVPPSSRPTIRLKYLPV